MCSINSSGCNSGIVVVAVVVVVVVVNEVVNVVLDATSYYGAVAVSLQKSGRKTRRAGCSGHVGIVTVAAMEVVVLDVPAIWLWL